MPLTSPSETKQLSKKMKSVLTTPGKEYCNADNMSDTEMPDTQ